MISLERPYLWRMNTKKANFIFMDFQINNPTRINEKKIHEHLILYFSYKEKQINLSVFRFKILFALWYDIYDFV